MSSKIKKRLFVTFIIFVLCAMSALTVQAANKTGWIRTGKNYKYKVDDKYVKNEVKKIGKYYYYFDKKGNRKTGWKKFKGRNYYFNLKNARAYTGKKTINGKVYIFAKNGTLIKKKGVYKYKKYKVYITSDASLATGPVKIKGKWYFYKRNGLPESGIGIYKWKDKTYYVKSGKMVSGWVKIKHNRKYFSKSDYAMVTGLNKIDNKLYWFDNNGNLQKNRFYTVGNSKYYLGKNGVCSTGLVKIGVNLYYFGTDGKMVTGKYISQSGVTYYADETGRIKQNCWYDGKFFDRSGKLVKDAVTYDSTTEGQVTEEMLDALPLSGCTKLMVVAHPDDETLFGGAHLTEGGWFVVCLTNGYNQVRKKEFYEAMNLLECTGMILSYPDIANGERSKWETKRYNIAKDLDTILNYKRWGMVATHNPDGEYGHIHHKMTSKLVTESFYRNYWGTGLYYFGRWHSKVSLQKVTGNLKRVPTKALQTKLNILKCYISQKGAVDTNVHMAEYENWENALNW